MLCGKHISQTSLDGKPHRSYCSVTAGRANYEGGRSVFGLFVIRPTRHGSDLVAGSDLTVIICYRHFWLSDLDTQTHLLYSSYCSSPCKDQRQVSRGRRQWERVWWHVFRHFILHLQTFAQPTMKAATHFLWCQDSDAVSVIDANRVVVVPSEPWGHFLFSFWQLRVPAASTLTEHIQELAAFHSNTVAFSSDEARREAFVLAGQPVLGANAQRALAACAHGDVVFCSQRRAK